MTFDLHLAAGSRAVYCLAPPGSCTDSEWLSILPADGGDRLSQVYGCAPDCGGDCQPLVCPLVCVPTTALGDAGAHRSWDGTYVLHQTCGASVACTRTACAQAGNYIARLCGYPETTDASVGLGECLGSTTPTCTDLPFVWPPPSGASSVQGEIGGGSKDSGASD